MKKILSLVLCAVMLLSSLSLFVSARGEHNFNFGYYSLVNDDGFSLGNVNGDGAVNAIDAYDLKRSIAGFDNEIVFDAADFCADGRLNSTDVYYLKTCLSGLKSVSDFESDKRVYSFRIGGIDASEFKFVLPEGTTYDDNIYFAYELLYSYMGQATGIYLEKIYAPEETEHGIYFHDVTGTELGDKYGDDGFKYEESDGNLHIYGTMRGNMYAAYDIIEEYLGYLFYDNTYVMSTKKRCSDIKTGTVNEQTGGFKIRMAYSGTWGSTVEWTKMPRRVNSANIVGSADKYHGYSQGSRYLNSHSYWFYLPMGSGEMPDDDGTMSLADRYYQKYLNGGGFDGVKDNIGQPCAISDDSFETLFQGLLDTVEMVKARGTEMLIKEGVTSLSFSMNDSADYCKCKYCRAIANGTDATRASASVAESLKEWYPGEFETEETKNGLTLHFHKEGYIALYVALGCRAAVKIQDYYPGAYIETLVYGCQVPETIKPVSNLMLSYCGAISGCVNHHYGEHNCNVTGQVKDDPAFHSIVDDENAIIFWVTEAEKVGSYVTVGIYASDNFTYYLYDLPCYFDLYYNIKWLYEHGVKGTGDDSPNNMNACNGFESLKGLLFAELMWNPEMTFDEYTQVIKKYLKAIYGYGYEHVYNYLVELCNANEEISVCVPYFAGMFDFYSKNYVRDHYEYMRNELILAKAQQGNLGHSYCTNLDKLFMTCEFLGLSACYESMYVNGDAESRCEYEQRYTDLYNFMKNNISVYSVEPSFTLPSTISFDKSPVDQIYKTGHRYKAIGYWCE